MLTHFDSDHIGGLADFPDAQVHVTSAEARGAIHAPSFRERVRYRSVQWAHGPKLVEHGHDGESSPGFAAAKTLDAIADGVVLVPMPGHTRGHAAVAVDAGDRWILHCGDAFYHVGTLDGQSKVPFVLRSQEELFSFDRRQLRDNQARLAELQRRQDPGLLIICAHDPSLYAVAKDLS
ncbi:metallo-beta-lactamase superfamily protein [Mycobacterium ulcerans str. Harvey]|uniref:Metallo-beta-lactamase superfamily protein n=1 Tax=Mycobacterium ulcerans str. Harvey TaxID=1299332 RepID=A0ABN0QWW4_MYCUL|nr:metallo-beta-lactamase superfamily protein [Mycobacterium ulcerans str. Harvey]